MSCLAQPFASSFFCFRPALHCPALASMSSLSTVLQRLLSASPEQRVQAFRGLAVHRVGALQSELRRAPRTMFGPEPSTEPPMPAPAQPPRGHAQPSPDYEAEENHYDSRSDDSWDTAQPSSGYSDAPRPAPFARQTYVKHMTGVALLKKDPGPTHRTTTRTTSGNAPKTSDAITIANSLAPLLGPTVVLPAKAMHSMATRSTGKAHSPRVTETHRRRPCHRARSTQPAAPPRHAFLLCLLQAPRRDPLDSQH